MYLKSCVYIIKKSGFHWWRNIYNPLFLLHEDRRMIQIFFFRTHRRSVVKKFYFWKSFIFNTTEGALLKKCVSNEIKWLNKV